MNITLRFAFALLLSLGVGACGETSGSVLEPIPESTTGPPGGSDNPPGSLLRVDVFLVRDMDTCAIGSPCNRNNDPDTRGDAECFELENGAGDRIGFRDNVIFVAPGDERIQTAEQAQCFSLPIDTDLADAVKENFDELRQRVFSQSRGEILLEIVTHDVPPMNSGFVKYENEWGIFLDSSALRASASAITRETDFVYAVTGARDPEGGFAPIVEHCAGTIRGIEQGLAGSPYTWLTPECDGSDSLLRHWMFQVAVALRDVNDFNDLYDHDYPPCGEFDRNDPAEWWPTPDECSVDPDSSDTCGENRCEGTDDDYVGHVLTAHWPRGRDFVGNHCANNEQDFDEMGVDTGGESCSLLGN
jgi:hypothetical protein